MPESDTGRGFLDTPVGKVLVLAASAALVAATVALFLKARADRAQDGARWNDGSTGPTKAKPKAIDPEGPTMREKSPNNNTRIRREDGKVWIEGLRQRPMWMTHMGCLIECADYLKVDASPAWIYGGTGYAFALNIHEVICPSGPTAWPAEKCEALAANVGINTERFQGAKSREDVDGFRETIWKRTRQAIDAGLPALGWEMGVPEWYVVHGYDADGNYLYRDFGDKTGKRHYTKLGDTGIGWICMVIATKGEADDDRTTVREAFRFAVEHGAGKHSNEKWHTGLSGYDTWIRALEDDEAVKGEVIGFGCAYNAQCWAECRRQAVTFLEEAKKRLDDEKLIPLSDEAIKHYTVVRDRLDAVGKIFPFDVRDEVGMDLRFREADRRTKAVEALRAARTAEASGLKVLAKIADALDAQPEAP